MSVTKASFMTQARTWILLAALTGLFIAIGAALGGGFLWIFVAFSIFMNVAAYWMSDKFAIRASKAQPVSEEQAPELYKIVREVAELYQLPMPRVFMIPSDQPNAFATGRNPKHAAVAVTQGLMKMMPPEQIKGVLAHEFGHIRNRDILVSSIAAMIAGAISAIGNVLLWTSLFGGEDNEGGLGGIAALLIMLLAPIAAALLQLGVSRQREYLADATAARVLGEGKPLADALETLERTSQVVPQMQVNPSTASLYIVHPFRGGGVTNLFNTHPPISERIRRLEEYDAARGIHYG
jgi:heat shock protein HtpX